MAMPIEQLEREDRENDFNRLLTRLQATDAQKEALWGALPPFDLGAWIAETGPADPDDLAEMEAILRERDIERQRSLESEAQAPPSSTG